VIARGLRREGHATDVATRGEDAIWMAGATEYDALVLDVMPPRIDGFETCRRLRDHGVWTPLLMLTARDPVEDRVAGLDHGADDYMVKTTFPLFRPAPRVSRRRTGLHRSASGSPKCSSELVRHRDQAPRRATRERPLGQRRCDGQRRGSRDVADVDLVGEGHSGRAPVRWAERNADCRELH